MNWDALGAIGELVGAAAVVLTLGYLAVQIRQSSKSSRQQSYNDLVTRRVNIFNKMVESDNFTAILIAGMRGDAMNEIEAQRFTSWSLNHVSHVQDVYLQWRNGLVEENVWLAERQFLAVAVGLPGRHVEIARRTPVQIPHRLADVRHVEHVVAVTEETVTGVVEDREARDESGGAVLALPENLIPLADDTWALGQHPVLGRRPAVTGQP